MTMTVTAEPAVDAPARTVRVASIDIVRGIVMVLMAIDHVRVYSGVPAGGPSPGVFFTRWATHFCAPVFVFLAGTSAFMLARSLENRAALARHLVSRGLVLVLLELTVIRASWTFGVDYSQFILAGVIWMLGWCMVLLAAIVWLPAWAIGTIGVAVVAGQDVFRALPAGWLSQFIYLGGEITLRDGGPSVSVLYTIVPWVGVMAAGFAFGAILTGDAATRRRWCLGIGFGATAVFLLIAGASVIAAAPPDGAPPAYVRLLNQRKYPASQLFLLMTLGPAIALMPFVERARAPMSRLFETFGRVPMFYYLLHIPLIHAVSLIVWRLRDGDTHAVWFATAPYVFVPPPQRWSLALLYLVFAAVVAALYPMCRWYAAAKAERRAAWMRYV